jgi:DNA primase
MNQSALLILLESVLGKGKPTSKGNYSFFCPFCPIKHHKRKLEIQLSTDEKGNNPYKCWICEEKGQKITTLLKKLKFPQDKISEAKLLTKTGIKKETKVLEVLSLPKEFISLQDIDEINNHHDKILAKHALKFISNRKVSEYDILKYNIGFCPNGKYEGRIIIPSYDEVGNLNYFTARSFKDDFEKYKNPPVSAKDIIGLELNINWNLPILLVEGIFDAIKFKRNTIPLFGKVIHNKLLSKLVQSQTKKIYICLDKDALKDAIIHCEKLISYGKEVHLIEIDDKDFSESENFKILNVLEESSPLTYKDLIYKKLEVI